MDREAITAVLGDSWRVAEPTSSDDLALVKANDNIDGMCAGKTRHKSEFDAMSEAKRSKNFLDIYLCKNCGFYHVGKNKERHKVVQKKRRSKK